jgi:hypothetical protein
VSRLTHRKDLIILTQERMWAPLRGWVAGKERKRGSFIAGRVALFRQAVFPVDIGWRVGFGIGDDA